MAKLTDFETFVRNNYYDPIPPDKYLDMFEEWLDNNPDASDDFGYWMGETFAQDVINQANLSEDDYWVIDVIADHCPLVYDHFLSAHYYSYLVNFFADHINKSKNERITPPEDGLAA